MEEKETLMNERNELTEDITEKKERTEEVDSLLSSEPAWGINNEESNRCTSISTTSNSNDESISAGEIAGAVAILVCGGIAIKKGYDRFLKPHVNNTIDKAALWWLNRRQERESKLVEEAEKLGINNEPEVVDAEEGKDFREVNNNSNASSGNKNNNNKNRK